MPLPLYEKIWVLTTLTHSSTTRTTSNKRKTAFSNHKQKKNRTNYWPTLHATMEMMERLQDKILALCRSISENTKTVTLRIIYHLKLAPTHLLMPKSGRADLLPSTTLTGTATDLPWVTTSSTKNFPHTTRKKRNWFFPATLLYKHRRPLPHQTPIPSSC